ncbi:Delta-dienoyl-CoA isomerase [Golovinomyces cichoracearum]|uniref:Delta-dienoyl-CoA isomerase n=1 Tax=Golovinomyces cichoracearum TaxID=62708 RepID=A0A420H8N7_9PEZI|nr:Delta-dienoyl-CoA isomerase [Golovinomyces cichoracearum]
MLRSIINHRKVFILALNGPAIGGGAAWFTGVADMVFASSNCFLQVPFSTLGLIPELGSAPIFSQSMGVHRANEFLMFDRRLDARELEASGILNRIFPEQDFQKSVTQYLSEILIASDGQSLMEAKRLMCEPLKEKRMVAVMHSIDALAKRFATGSPQLRFKKKTEELEGESPKIA